jgi:hypothetical protein
LIQATNVFIGHGEWSKKPGGTGDAFAFSGARSAVNNTAAIEIVNGILFFHLLINRFKPQGGIISKTVRAGIVIWTDKMMAYLAQTYSNHVFLDYILVEKSHGSRYWQTNIVLRVQAAT